MSIIVKVSTKNRETNAQELIKIASVIREALRAEGLYHGYDKSKPARLGKGYSVIFEVDDFHMIDRKAALNVKG